MMIKGVISVFIGRFPAMNTTEPYSPRARAKARANPVSKEGQICGRITRRKAVRRPAPKGRGRLLQFRVEIFQHGLHRADDEWQADEGERDHDSERSKRRHNAIRRKQPAHPACGRIDRGQSDSRHGSGQRERQIHKGID